MEALFKALGNPDRLWIAQYLAENGPTRHTDLLQALAETGREGTTRGVVGNILKPLIESGLVEHRAHRAPFELTNEAQIKRLLAAASALTVAAAERALREAERQQRGVMRAITKALPDQAAESAN